MGKSSGDVIWQDRYSRQIKFAAIGQSGQQLLQEATVLIVGSGALGASLAQHLTRAGVKKIRLVDRDYVEPSNLQRQMLFTERDALQMLPKAIAAREALRQINREVEIEAIVAEVSRSNVADFMDGVQLVLDGTDNAAIRLLLSDSCFALGIPYLFGGVAGAEGMSALLIPGQTACLRCVIGDESLLGNADTCDTVGVLSPAVEMVVAMQIMEALKWLTNNRAALHGEWVSFDLWSLYIRRSRLPKRVEACSHCAVKEIAAGHEDDFQQNLPSSDSDQTIDISNNRYEAAVLCGRDSIQVTVSEEVNLNLDLEKLVIQLQQLGCSIFQNKYLVKATVITGERLVVFGDGRILVQGTSEIEKAYQLCDQYILALDLEQSI
ncbi:ThiF family adenylyltransferase [Paenibacillus yanchengensis]|uniref:ThiF family adenylyltransferase n=1 Tax=Paenibacillus yanchengensis TaxID=2035833 RepID=A0ABW4YN12_9BACL